MDNSVTADVAPGTAPDGVAANPDDRIVVIDENKLGQSGPSCMKHERIKWELRKDEVSVGSQNNELKGLLQQAIKYKGVREVEALVRDGAPLGAEYPLEEDGYDGLFGTALDVMMLCKRYKLVLGVLDLGIMAEIPRIVAPDTKPAATADAIEPQPNTDEAGQSDSKPDGATEIAENAPADESVFAATEEPAIVDTRSIGTRLAQDSPRAFMLAAQEGKVQIIQRLLAFNASVAQCDKEGRSALLMAASRGHKNCVDVLIQGRAYEHEKKTERSESMDGSF